MSRRIAIQYRESSSFLNRMNPVVKLIWLVFLSALILTFRDYRCEIVLLACGLALFCLTGIRLSTLQGFKFVLMTSVFLGLLQLLFIHEGSTLFGFGGFFITSTGFENALLISSRFFSFVLMGYIFVLTTEPNTFVYALMQVGLPYRFGFSLITALRLIPILTNEAANILYAQLTRGVVYRFTQPGRLIKNIYQFLRVLLISTIKKVDDMVLAMEGRSFGAAPTRTYNRMVGFSKLDVALLVLALVVTSLILIIRKDFAL